MIIVLRLASSLAFASLLVLSVFAACTDPDKSAASHVDASANDAGGFSAPLMDASALSDATPRVDASMGDAQPALPTGPSPFGKMCESAADCAPGLLCLQSDGDDWLGGGPGHGYCSLDCTADPDLCLAYDSRARCLTGRQMAEAYCMKGCTLGDATGEAKCAGRQDLSCALVGLLPSCLPNCGGDADCPADRHCNEADGNCVAGPRTGDPAGVACDPSEFTTNCDAYCSTLENGEGVCSGLCTIGAPYACNVPVDIADVVGTPLCMSFIGNRPGDVGMCVQRCRCNGDCDHPSAYCDLERPEAHDGIGVCLYDYRAEPGTLGVQCSTPSDAAALDGDL